MKQAHFQEPPAKEKGVSLIIHSFDTKTHDHNPSQVESCSSFSPSSALVQSRKIVPLSAPPGVTVVLLLVPETWCRVMTLGDEPSLGTEVTLRVVLTSEVATLVVLEANFVWLDRAMRVGSHGVDVALMPSNLSVVELVEGAGERACGVGVLGDLCSLCHVTVHEAD